MPHLLWDGPRRSAGARAGSSYRRDPSRATTRRRTATAHPPPATSPVARDGCRTCSCRLSSRSTCIRRSRRDATSFAPVCRSRALSASRTSYSRRRRSRSSLVQRGRRRGGNTTGSCSSRWYWRSVPSSSSSTAGARAALDMRRRIAELNAGRAARGEEVVQFGVGIHTGDVVVGTIGLRERSQYDAFGDAVNTASRMQTLTKDFKVDSILSRDTADRLRDDGVALRPLGVATVRGKANAVKVFTLG